MRKVMTAVFVTLGSISLLFAFQESTLKWLSLGATVLFFTKAATSFFLRQDSQRTTGQKHLPKPKDWRIIMIGYFLSAGLLLASGLAGEGWIGFVAAPALLLTSLVFRFVARKLEVVQGTTER